MLTLTFVFALLVFYRLGNASAPQSAYEITSENPDIILDFGQYLTVEQLDIYLGNLESRSVTLSTYNEVSKEWEIIGDRNIISVFQWNKIDVYYNLRYLGLVSTDYDSIFNEIVCLGENGAVISPINIEEYPELFDEQDLYYDTAETTYMNGTMFDEIYHARTGYEFVHALTTYETTHPPLGKCLIALGIRLFGMTPFGYRFFVAVFGTLFVPLIYCFSKALFKNTYVSTCTALLFSFDCLHFTLSRIATIDIFVAFFIVLSYYFMYRYITEFNLAYTGKDQITGALMPYKVTGFLALSGLAIGLAIATKLTGVYAGAGLAVIFLFHTFTHYPPKKVGKLAAVSVLFFIIVPLSIYVLSYIPVVEADYRNIRTIHESQSGLISKTIRGTVGMIRYHANLNATHPYMSDFYSWPVGYKPVLIAYNTVSQTADKSLRSIVYYMGNVAVWWAAIPCILYVFYIAIAKREKTAMLLTVSYLAQYIPWMGVQRCVFLYHYFPSFIFSVLMMGYAINSIANRKPALKRLITAYMVVVIITFFLFYPVVSGVPFPYEWTQKLNRFMS